MTGRDVGLVAEIEADVAVAEKGKRIVKIKTKAKLRKMRRRQPNLNVYLFLWKKCWPREKLKKKRRVELVTTVIQLDFQFSNLISHRL